MTQDLTRLLLPAPLAEAKDSGVRRGIHPQPLQAVSLKPPRLVHMMTRLPGDEAPHGLDRAGQRRADLPLQGGDAARGSRGKPCGTTSAPTASRWLRPSRPVK
jgi:hypothetical protein